jgi:hypothetical protein
MRVDTAASKKWRAIETSMKPIVAYVRVSTNQQGRSGLGVEAQREAMSRFAQSEGVDLVAEFVEVETGKGSDALDRRPQLAAALDRARALRCPVAVSKLDRLSRDVHFVFRPHEAFAAAQDEWIDVWTEVRDNEWNAMRSDNASGNRRRAQCTRCANSTRWTVAFGERTERAGASLNNKPSASTRTQAPERVKAVGDGTA